MKNKKTPTFILVVILLLAIPFSLASCMGKEDYYTKEDISSLVSTLENKIAQIKSDYEAAFLSRHEHTFGEWINYVGNENVYCENRLFYRICTECSVLEWKSGTYDNHSFSTVTTPPTCVSVGYDTKTCSICGKIEKINETPMSDHIWKDNYSYDNSFHWIDCNYCDAEKEKAEHTTDESGYCTVCDKPVGATEGIIYEISPDRTYASVVGYDGTAVRVKIADMYEGIPVRKLCESAFREKNIVSVIIPDSVTSIGVYAFFNCESLTSVTFGENSKLESIGVYAFDDCNSSLYTEYEYGKYIGDSNNPYAVLIGLTNKNLSSYKINEQTKFISNGVFASCSRLGSIAIPNGVTSIGDYSFRDCSSLTSVTIPDSVTSIGSYAFSGCRSLTSITIGDSVTSIGYGAFSGCSSLTSLVIPDSVTSIGDYAFLLCSSLTSIKYRGTQSQWNAISNHNTGSYTITYNYEGE